jgi:hypothetical protein
VKLTAQTESETAALRRIAGMRSRLLVASLVGMSVTLSARLIPNAGLQIAVATLAALTVIGAALYLSFGLRCPRCSSWIPAATSATSKCTSCGMSLHIRDAVHSTVSPLP